MRDALRRADDTTGRLIDGLTDWALAGFAAWVLLSYLATITRAPVQPFVVLWLVLLVPIAALQWWLGRRASRREPESGEPAEPAS